MTNIVVYKIENRHTMLERHKLVVHEKYLEALAASRWIDIGRSIQYRTKFKEYFCSVSIAGGDQSRQKFEDMIKDWLVARIIDNGFYGFMSTSHASEKASSDRRRLVTEVIIRFSDERDYIAFEEDFLILLRLQTNNKIK